MAIQLKEGEYYGDFNHKNSFNGITITDTKYTHEYVDWHTHENPYFTLLLYGQLIEENKKESYQLTQGSLLFHNWEDSHRNIKPPVDTRGAHVEINKHWFESLNLRLDEVEGSLKIKNPQVKNAIFKIILESKNADAFNKTSIEFLLTDIFCSISEMRVIKEKIKPVWLDRLDEMIHDESEDKLSAKVVSQELGIHPVHLSRTFHKYYRMTFGQYCRAVMLHKAVNAILTKKYSLSEVAHMCHYYDHSHMVSVFKKHFNISPKQLIKSIG